VSPEAAVLFDLDGTLADTAPDLAAAVNRMRRDQGLGALPIERLRPFASAGARGLVFAGLGVKPEDAEYEALRETFLDFYAEDLCVHTRLFPGIGELLADLARRKLAWGVVTNKATRFTERLVAELKLAVEPACVVCGDSTPHLKPHPAPLLLAAERLAIDPKRCWYLGDDLRDIQAARAAGMRPVAVEWGYHHPDKGAPAEWQADAVISRPSEMLSLLENS
jgi:N-acetyl-D-muramate 6-phosphate phosphatase